MLQMMYSCFFLRYGGPPRFGGGGGGSRGGPSGKFGNPGERLRKKHWNLDELPKFQKNFYQEHPDTSRRPLVRPVYSCFLFIFEIDEAIFFFFFNPHCSSEFHFATQTINGILCFILF